MDNKTTWYCDKCGIVSEVQVYNKSLKKPGFKIAPILPLCKRCGNSVVLSESNKIYSNKILVLTGPCGSGKTSIAEYLYQNHEFNAVDLDCLIDLVKYRFNKKSIDFNSKEVINELTNSINILLHYEHDLVLSLIIQPDKLDMYKDIFRSFGVQYKIVFLYSDYTTILNRTKTRKCFNSVTPEKWVKHFYDEMMPLKDVITDHFNILDSTDSSIEETANILLKSFK